MKIITRTIYGLFILLLLGVTGLFLASLAPIPGNIEIKIVKSGSMAPSIPTGSLVIVKPAGTYAVGDVITFGEDSPRRVPTTHRIVNVSGSGASAIYTTKGDANEEADPEPVRGSDVVGKVMVAAPYAGFILDFAKQPMGFALLIGVPAALIILEELLAIARETRTLIRKRKHKKDDGKGNTSGGGAGGEIVFARQRTTDDIFVPMRLAAAGHTAKIGSEIRVSLPAQAGGGRDRRVVFSLLLMCMVGTYTLSNAAGATLSYFSDFETSLNNFFQAGEWLPPADPQDIVLNEFLPNPDPSAGGLNFGDDNDSKPLGEWIELYNKGPVDQDIAGWYMTDASGGVGNTHAVIGPSNTNTGNTIILAGGWLVVYMNKPSLNNTGDEIYLYSPDNTQIDVVSYDDPSSDCENDPTQGTGNVGTGQTGVPGNGPNADCVANQVAPNKSYARIPDGTGGWIDPIPTPGAPNIPDEELVEATAAPEEEVVVEEENVEEPPVEQGPALLEDVPAAAEANEDVPLPTYDGGGGPTAPPPAPESFPPEASQDVPPIAPVPEETLPGAPTPESGQTESVGSEQGPALLEGDTAPAAEPESSPPEAVQHVPPEPTPEPEAATEVLHTDAVPAPEPPAPESFSPEANQDVPPPPPPASE